MQDLATYRGPSADYFMGKEPTDIGRLHREYAVGRVLSDVESFVQQLEGCTGHVDSDFILRVPGRLLQADDAVVLHALLTATDDAHIRACRDELVRRYLQRSENHVQRLAGELAAEGE